MLPNHRRHLYLVGNERRQSRFIGRAIFGIIAVIIAWYLVSRVFALFDHAVGRRSPAFLQIRSSIEGVQVSLQGGEWQRGENSLKLYPGDGIAARGDSDVILSFFDGTRMRLDKGSELTLDQSDSFGDKSESRIEVTLKSGRIWVNTPNLLTYSGSITRLINLPSYKASLPPNTNALLGASKLTVLKAQGIGLKISLLLPKVSTQSIFIGEGQSFNLDEEAKRGLSSGIDPYEYRDPTSQQTLNDAFLVESYNLFGSSTAPKAGSVTLTEAVPAGSGQDLTLSSPDNHVNVTSKTVTVEGRVSPRVSSLLVNGQTITIKKDLSFSVEISLSKDASTQIKVEAQDSQGIPISEIDRTIVNAYQPQVLPVRIKSPVGSGETLTTSQTEIEITGEAPQGTSGIIVNDYRLQLFKPGEKTWSYLASEALGNLITGSNIFTIYALDSDGNKSPARSITIELKPEVSSGTGTVQPPIKQNAPLTPGVLSVTAPASGTSVETSQKEIVIEGQTSADTYSISINGYTLSLYLPQKTTWNYIASTELQTMKRGKNVYRIVARNKNGEILDILEYTITFKP